MNKLEKFFLKPDLRRNPYLKIRIPYHLKDVFARLKELDKTHNLKLNQRVIQYLIRLDEKYSIKEDK